MVCLTFDADCVSEMKKEYDETGGCPITDDCRSLERLCAKLELLLQTGLKGLLTL